MKTLVIEREAVKNNIGVIKERAGEAVIYAVLTGDGQGAGLVELARLLREEGIGRCAVSEPAEAAALRRAGFVEEEILMLRPTVDRAELEQLIDLNVVCTVGSADTVPKWQWYLPPAVHRKDRYFLICGNHSVAYRQLLLHKQ